LYQFHGKLILPAWGVYADAPGAKHVQAIAQKLKGGRPWFVENLACKRIKGLLSLPLHVPKPDALQLRILIFKAEIDMTGTGA
jgi:hypothetical protein